VWIYDGFTISSMYQTKENYLLKICKKYQDNKKKQIVYAGTVHCTGNDTSKYTIVKSLPSYYLTANTFVFAGYIIIPTALVISYSHKKDSCYILKEINKIQFNS
jgi:hypothetical protein